MIFHQCYIRIGHQRENCCTTMELCQDGGLISIALSLDIYTTSLQNIITKNIHTNSISTCAMEGKLQLPHTNHFSVAGCCSLKMTL